MMKQTVVTNLAKRVVNAEVSFIEFAMRTANLTHVEAVNALKVYRKYKAIKIDAIGGQFSFTHGDFAEADVLQKAANTKL